ncbi:MAG TPA: hypothetical protein VMT93_08355 [Gemmatimonadaceae bacterium]|nr:hypothetical protein [Gemmatimonadaceae bacterium]
MSIRAITLAMLIAAAPAAAAQNAAPDTGAVAPAFSAPGANKDGLLKSVSLADYKGKTVVIAFFYHARTKG